MAEIVGYKAVFEFEETVPDTGDDPVEEEEQQAEEETGDGQ